MSDDDFELDSQPTISKPTTVAPDIAAAFLPQSEPLDLTTSRQQLNQISIPTSQEATRAKIAWTFTQLFLLIVIISLVLPTIIKIGFPEVIGDPIETTKTLLTLVASVLAGPFGFIVGFYFKQDTQG
jgi:hypothetical protein